VTVDRLIVTHYVPGPLPETTVTTTVAATAGFEVLAVIDLPYVQRVFETIYPTSTARRPLRLRYETGRR